MLNMKEFKRFFADIETCLYEKNNKLIHLPIMIGVGTHYNVKTFTINVNGDLEQESDNMIRAFIDYI